MLLSELPPEILSYILSFLSASSLASVCRVNHALLSVSLPVLYNHLDCQNLASTISCLRRLSKDATSFIAQHASEVRSIRLPRTPATHEVKAGIAAALAIAVVQKMLPNLVLLDWPFGYIRRGFLEDEDAARFDEPLWEALLLGCPNLLVYSSCQCRYPC